MAYGIKEQECRLDLSKKHTGKCYQHLPTHMKQFDRGL